MVTCLVSEVEHPWVLVLQGNMMGADTERAQLPVSKIANQHNCILHNQNSTDELLPHIS